MQNSLVFLWRWTGKSVVPHELGQTSQRLGVHRQENDTFEEASRPSLCCAAILERRSQVQEGQGDHSLSKYGSNNDNYHMHSCGMVWFNQNS